MDHACMVHNQPAGNNEQSLLPSAKHAWAPSKQQT